MVHLIQLQIKSVEKRDKQYLKRVMVWRNILDTIKYLSNLQYTDMTVIAYCIDFDSLLLLLLVYYARSLYLALNIPCEDRTK